MPRDLPQLHDVYIGSHPIVRRCSVSLAGDVFCEESIAWSKSHAGSIAEPNVDRPREGYYPASAWCSVPLENMRGDLVSKEKAEGWACGVKEFRRLAGIELLEMGLPIVAAIQSIEFHARPFPFASDRPRVWGRLNADTPSGSEIRLCPTRHWLDACD